MFTYSYMCVYIYIWFYVYARFQAQSFGGFPKDRGSVIRLVRVLHDLEITISRGGIFTIPSQTGGFLWQRKKLRYAKVIYISYYLIPHLLGEGC